jgi:acetyltransferase
MDVQTISIPNDDTVLTVRRLALSDTERLIAFVKALSVTARYFRFGQGDYNNDLEEALHMCVMNPDRGAHLIAVASRGSDEVVVGSARYVIQADRTSCEFVIVVADKWSHHGIGHELMGALIDSAKSQGLRKMWGRILASNLDMLAFVRGQGFDISDCPDRAWQKIASITF